MEIIDATKEDASMIAYAIMTAIGEEICRNIAGDNNTIGDVKDIFTRLASSSADESQYSYQNTRVAVDGEGRKMGFCVSYDGAKIKELRRSFFEEAIKTLGWQMTKDEIESVPPETGSEEFYLDSLAVLPEFRGRGVGRALIMDAAEKAKSRELPLGLLVEKENDNAKRLYESCGFKGVGVRPFAGVEMKHMIFSQV